MKYSYKEKGAQNAHSQKVFCCIGWFALPAKYVNA